MIRSCWAVRSQPRPRQWVGELNYHGATGKDRPAEQGTRARELSLPGLGANTVDPISVYPNLKQFCHGKCKSKCNNVSDFHINIE